MKVNSHNKKLGGRKDALIVAGMHRSGTSAMARVLSLAGAALPARLMPPGLANPEGHWEPLDVTALNDKIFREFNSTWDDLFGPQNLRQRKFPIKRFLGQARRIIRKNYNAEELIILKDPRISIFPELWEKALFAEGYRVSFVLMVRNPKEVAASLGLRDGFVENKSLILWATSMLSVYLYTIGRSRVFISYDEIFMDTESLLNKIECSLDVLLPNRTSNSTIAIQQFIKQSNRHHRVISDEVELQGFPEIERFYGYLQAATEGETRNEETPTELAQWLGRLEHATAPIVKDLEARVNTNNIASTSREVEFKNQIDRLELALREAELSSSHLMRRLEEVSQNVAHIESNPPVIKLQSRTQTRSPKSARQSELNSS